MFSTGHLIWIAVSIILIVFGVICCIKLKPSLHRLISLCLLLGLISEAVKVLSVIEIVPVMDLAVKDGVLVYVPTGDYTPYLEAEHLPFELCSYPISFLLAPRA